MARKNGDFIKLMCNKRDILTLKTKKTNAAQFLSHSWTKAKTREQNKKTLVFEKKRENTREVQQQFRRNIGEIPKEKRLTLKQGLKKEQDTL